MMLLKGETTNVEGTGLTTVNILTHYLTWMLINSKHQGRL